ncbi:unnamed protein product [Effrenium voratum]|nr:unnamed protein product [Effrenium voratum]
MQTAKVQDALKNRVVSPTPSSLCPTESTAPGDAELDYDSDTEKRPASRFDGQVRNWTQVSERLRGLFQELDPEEEDSDFEAEAECAPAFGSVLACDTQVSSSPAMLPLEREPESPHWQDWRAVGSRLANVLQQMQEDSEEDQDEDEAEAEPEPM